MSLRKYLTGLFMLMLVVAIGCGQGKEVVDESELGEDDQALQTAAADNTGGDTGTPAAAAPVVADAATVAGVVKFEGTGPKLPALQMSADPF